MGALTGGSGVKVDIRVNPPDNPSPTTGVILDHNPSWRLHKNPFWRVKHPGGDKFHVSQQSSGMPSNQQQAMYSPVGQQQQQPPSLVPERSSAASTIPSIASGMQPPYAGNTSNMYNSTNNSMYSTAPATPLSMHGKQVAYAYEASQDISGSVSFQIPPGGKKFEHLGIKVQFIGRIDMYVRLVSVYVCTLKSLAGDL